MSFQAYFLIFKAHLSKDMSYRFNFLFAYVLRITQLLLSLTVWSIIFENKSEINGYNWTDIASYFALISVTSLLFYPNHMFEMQPLIRKGILSSFLVKPINFEIHVLAKYLSSKIPPLIIMSLFVAVVFNFLDIPIDIYINFFTSSVLVSCLLLTFCFGLCVSQFAFWLVEMWPLKRLFQGCMLLFGGVIAPLDLLPPNLALVASYTPFPYFGYFSVKMLQGGFTNDELVRHVCIILVWTLMLFLSFKILWKKGLKKYEAVNS
ncbi:ABC transporter permease [Parachlamydia acanthamoebae]|uniref:ABC transporter permease n=1 Tax=Parachlamydia acanthamoebae TaxID=83552 RepID=UPI000750E0A4|nr:ABC-2 family transporter protein [Parachlamydia acanthamoebae]